MSITIIIQVDLLQLYRIDIHTARANPENLLHPRGGGGSRKITILQRPVEKGRDLFPCVVKRD
jgi:hypothetical protein